MLETVPDRLQRWWRMASPNERWMTEPEVVHAYENAVLAASRQRSWSTIFFSSLAVVCTEEMRRTFEIQDAVVWALIFFLSQCGRLSLRMPWARVIPGHARMVIGATANALPFGILAFMAIDQMSQTAYTTLTVVYVFVVVTVVAIYPGFMGMHRVYNAVLLLPVAVGWLASAHESNVSMALALLLLCTAVEVASRHLYRSGLQQMRLEVANQRLTAELQGKVEVLEQSNQSRTRLLAAACHDVRQPIHAIGMMIEGLLLDRTSTEHRGRLQQLQRSHLSAAHMLSALMDLSRLENGGMHAESTDVALRDVLDEAREQFSVLAKPKGLALRIPDSQWRVRCDPYLLRRVIFNLLSNAIKFTPTGTVEVALRQVDQSVFMDIIDTGIGIPHSWQPQMFEAYAQLGRFSDGLGIGLAIVKSACALMKLPLSFESAPGVGTRFTLALGDALDLAQQVPEPSADAGTSAPRADGARLIAMIDDDAVTRGAAADMLRQWKFEVIDAAELCELMEQLQASADPPALLLTDLHLRHGSGLGAIRALRTLPGLEALPAVLITGDTHAALHDMVDTVTVLHKPVPPTRLREAISTLLA